MIRKNCCSEQLNERQVRELERAAANGDVPSMKRLFFFYDEAEEPAKAATWLRRAADAGDSEAELFMFNTLNGSKNTDQQRLALKYLHRAAEHGSSTAQATLGERYRDGVGVTRNVETAKYWLRRAARAGDPEAILALCDMAAAAHDIEQCRECLVLENHALTSLDQKSYVSLQLQEQRKRIGGILSDTNAN
jgi:TPR repeat protein